MAFVVLCTISLFTASCNGDKPAEADSLGYDTLQIDTTMAVDTTVGDAFEQLIAESPMPKTADELFDDFIFNFMANKKLQVERIQFPLQVNDHGKKSVLNRNEWMQERFWHNDIYTLILDNLNQLKAAKDTAINHVVIEKLFIDKDEAKQYEFNRIDGQWKMTALNSINFDAHKNASFLKFYQQFATDTLFQNQNMAESVAYYGPDPEDDTRNMKGVLPEVIWDSFANELPSGTIYNVIYGEDTKGSAQKILDMREPASSHEAQLTFTQRDGKWKLTKVSL